MNKYIEIIQEAEKWVWQKCCTSCLNKKGLIKIWSLGTSKKFSLNYVHLFRGLILIAKIIYCVIIYFGHFCPPDLFPVPALYAKIPDLYPNICVLSSTVPATEVFGYPYVVSFWWLRVERKLRNWVGEGEGEHVTKIFGQVCVQNYYGSRFIVLRQGPILGPSPVLGPEGD